MRKKTEGENFLFPRDKSEASQETVHRENKEAFVSGDSFSQLFSSKREE